MSKTHERLWDLGLRWRLLAGDRGLQETEILQVFYKFLEGYRVLGYLKPEASLADANFGVVRHSPEDIARVDGDFSTHKLQLSQLQAGVESCPATRGVRVEENQWKRNANLEMT